MRDIVMESWRRSLAAGVAPEAAGAPVRLRGDELDTARTKSLLAPTVAAILRALARFDHDDRHVVAISDARGDLLWVTGEERVVDRARGIHFEAGASCSEAAVGTNAIGTAIPLDHAVQIFSAEHLVTAVHCWTCSAAPIHDPISGELVGVVDLTADTGTAHPHTLSAVELAARAARAVLEVRRIEAAARLREVTLPDGRVGELEELEGGAILWLRRRRRYVTARGLESLVQPAGS